MGRNILLPPAVLDLIEQIRDTRRSNIHTQDHLAERLEAIEAACRIAIDEFKRRRRRILETTSR
jgi:hypothetical protein